MATILEKHKIQLPVQTMTYEEFLDWADEDTYAEWVDGKVEMMSPASIKTFRFSSAACLPNLQSSRTRGRC